MPNYFVEHLFVSYFRFGIDHFSMGSGPNVTESVSLFVVRVVPTGTVIVLDDQHIWMKLFTNSGQRQKGFLVKVELMPKMGKSTSCSFQIK